MNVELPKDAEGREIPLDTGTLYKSDGTSFHVSRVMYMRFIHEWWFFGHSGSEINSSSVEASAVYLTPPDSLEKLLDDLDRCIEDDGLCSYYSPSGKCSTCTLNSNGPCHCGSLALENIKKRIRKLMGEDDD